VTPDVRADLRAAAEAAKGFMPPDEGDALYRWARASADTGEAGPFFEVGSYCGKSTVYLGAAALEVGTVVFALDHHRGSEENQAGWEHHDTSVVDPELGKMDTLPTFRRTIHDAGLEGTVVALVGDSPTVGRYWTTALGFLFIDGGHGAEPAHRDYETWVPHVRIGGLLAIHDVFPDPADGGRPPYEIYCRALESDAFEDVATAGSLRVLRRTAPGV
jgi:predicted O-methyltransferase YrrM